jgi:hypothetical protein
LHSITLPLLEVKKKVRYIEHFTEPSTVSYSTNRNFSRHRRRVNFTFYVDKLAFAQASKPRPLPFRKAPRPRFDSRNHLVAVIFTGNVSQCLSIPDSLAGGAS